jgi:hypothetical protein
MPKKQASSKKTTSTLNSEFSEAAEASKAKTDATTDFTNQPGEVIPSKKKAKKTETAEDSQSPKTVRRNIPLVDLVSVLPSPKSRSLRKNKSTTHPTIRAIPASL